MVAKVHANASDGVLRLKGKVKVAQHHAQVPLA
jgi:hypothetical protein